MATKSKIEPLFYYEEEVLQLLRISEGTLDNIVDDGTFPAPVPVTGSKRRAKRWLVAEVQRYISGVIALRPQRGERP